MNPESRRGLRQGSWRIRFLKEVGPDEKQEILRALGKGLVPENRILETHSSVKHFYRVPSQGKCLFVKVRYFPSWRRRLGRALRPTKEERELANYELLESSGVPSPRAFASARLRRGLLPEASALVTQYLEYALPLKELLLGPQGPLLLEPLAGFFGLLKKARILHQDLQWENILAGSPRRGFPFFLVDPLHVRRMKKGEDELEFAMSLAWFLGFMMRGGAPRELVVLLAQHAARRGLCAPWGSEELLLRAERIGL